MEMVDFPWKLLVYPYKMVIFHGNGGFSIEMVGLPIQNGDFPWK
jgi:hypothetical protein